MGWPLYWLMLGVVLLIAFIGRPTKASEQVFLYCESENAVAEIGTAFETGGKDASDLVVKKDVQEDVCVGVSSEIPAEVIYRGKIYEYNGSRVQLIGLGTENVVLVWTLAFLPRRDT